MTAEEQIRAALEAGPTPGHWTQEADTFVAASNQQGDTVARCYHIQSTTAESERFAAAANARFIAACNPANVADLLAELDGERARSQMYADLVRAIAVVLHGEGWSDTSKLPEEVASLRAEVEALRKDAERYRWLREGYATLLLRYFPAPHKYLQASGVLDAAIDAAKGGE